MPLLNHIMVRGLFPQKEDQEKIEAYYRETPSYLTFSLNNFSQNLAWRVYTEWCCDYPHKDHAEYRGEGLKEFIDAETHYELERREMRTPSSEQYLLIKEDVLRGFVRMSINYFEESQEKTTTSKNLRCSLKDWIAPCLVSA